MSLYGRITELMPLTGTPWISTDETRENSRVLQYLHLEESYCIVLHLVTEEEERVA
jgi:hypothetical protein